MKYRSKSGLKTAVDFIGNKCRLQLQPIPLITGTLIISKKQILHVQATRHRWTSLWTKDLWNSSLTPWNPSWDNLDFLQLLRKAWSRCFKAGFGRFVIGWNADVFCAIVTGVVTLLKDHEVCKQGDVLTPEQARVLVRSAMFHFSGRASCWMKCKLCFHRNSSVLKWQSSRYRSNVCGTQKQESLTTSVGKNRWRRMKRRRRRLMKNKRTSQACMLDFNKGPTLHLRIWHWSQYCWSPDPPFNLNMNSCPSAWISF